jgi:hypothetical protein
LKVQPILADKERNPWETAHIMELEELNKYDGMPILYKAFLITENQSPAFLDLAVPDQSPKHVKTAGEKNRAFPTVLTEGAKVTPPFLNLNRYTANNSNPSFKNLIDSIYDSQVTSSSENTNFEV